MARVAALIAHTGNPAMRQFVFSAERVVIGVGRGFIRRKSGQGYGRAASNRQIIGAKGYDGIWIRGISIRAVYIGRKSAAIVQKLAVGGAGRAIWPWQVG